MTKPTPAPTVAQALALASLHWDERSGGRVMSTMANRCGALVGLAKLVHSLSPEDGVRLLAALRGEGLSPKSAKSYYGAFRRALTLSGVSSALWPAAPSTPRKTRDALEPADLDRIITWFREHRLEGHSSTADLAVLLRATGARINVEALSDRSLRISLGDGPFDTLHVTGKGGHERLVPVVDPECRALLRDLDRMRDLKSVTYSAHLKRWRKAVKALGITSRLPTPHAVRHLYATNALDKSGGNLTMVQELLGHSDPATTAKYLHVDLMASAKVLSQ